MPFAPKLKKDEEMDKNQGGGVAPNISGVSTSFNVPGQNAGAMTKGAKSSGQYQNLQKYLNANQEQGTQMGQKLAGNVEKEVGESQQALGQLKGSVQKVQDYDPNEVLKNIGGANEEQKSQYKATKQTGGYTGPSDAYGLSDYGKAYKEQQDAESALALTGNESGQKELLKQAYNRPSYTGGAQRLDQVLLSQSAGGKQAIESLGQKYKDLSNQFKTGIEQTGQEIAAQKAMAEANKQKFAGAEETAKRNILSPIEQRVADAQANAAKWSNYQQDIADLRIDPEIMAALGIGPNQRVFDLNIGSYFNPETQSASVQNLASKDERAQYNQLMDFLGTNAGELGMGDPTYQGPRFDKDRLIADAGAKQVEYQRLQDTRAGDLIKIDPGTNTGLGVKSGLADALNSMSISQITKWYNSLPQTSANAADVTKDSYQVQQLKKQLDQINSTYSPDRVINGPAQNSFVFNGGRITGGLK